MMTAEQYAERGYQQCDYDTLSQWQRWRNWQQARAQFGFSALPEIVINLNLRRCLWHFGLWGHQNGFTYSLGPIRLEWWFE